MPLKMAPMATKSEAVTIENFRPFCSSSQHIGKTPITNVMVPQLGIIAKVESLHSNANCIDDTIGPNVFHTKYCIQDMAENTIKIYHLLCNEKTKLC